MTVLKVDQARAREVFGKRSPEAFEIPVLMLFKTPVDAARLLSQEFAEALDDGVLTREIASTIIDRLRKEAVLIPAIESNENMGSESSRAIYFSLLSSIGRLTQGLSGDLISMSEHAEQRVTIHGHTPGQLLHRIVNDLTALKQHLEHARDEFAAGQLLMQGAARSSLDKIHLGSGSKVLEGWHNIDMIGGNLRLNLCSTLPFNDESIRLAFSAHTIEHLDYHTSAPRLLREIARVLRHGGVLRLAVPDIGAYARAYATENARFFADYDRVRPEFGAAAGYDTPLSKVMLMSGSAMRPGAWFDHKMGYDFETLSKLLTHVGFSSVQRSHFGGSDHPELQTADRCSSTSQLRFANIENSLFVEATK